MQQEINLYRYLPKEKSSYFKSKIIISSYLAFLGVLILSHGIISWQSYSLRKKVAQLNREVTTQQQTLSDLIQLHPITDLTKLTEDIQRLQTEYEIQSRNLDLLLPYPNFSNYLLGLAKTIVDGVWLTDIKFNRGENKIILQGNALDTASLKNFYAALSKESIFSNLIFKIDEIKQNNFPANFAISAKEKIKT